MGWALNPIPNNGHDGSTCDDWTGYACTHGCPTELTPEAAAAKNMTAPVAMGRRVMQTPLSISSVYMNYQKKKKRKRRTILSGV
jgi:hypothetical protein